MRPVFLMLPVLMLLAGAAALAHDGVVDKGVHKRMDAMAAAKAAIDRLGAMMGGQVRFDPGSARAARRTLIRATGAIPRLFRKPHSDPLSRARPEIWHQKTDFRARAEAAERAARRLNTRSLNRLRQTLPDVLSACLDCHRTYRVPR